MNLHKTLKAYNEISVRPEQEMVLNEALSIIENSEQSDRELLSKLGMDRNLLQFDKITKDNNEAMQFDEIYDISVIKKMAVHYGLRFLPSDVYKGTIDPFLPSILNKFISKYDIEILERTRHTTSDFYILAPASSFDLQPVPKDPIMFYRINENKYAFIHKWGNDLNGFRKVSNYFFRTGGHFCLLFSSLLIIALTIVSLIVGNGLPFAFLALLLLNGLFITEGNFNSDSWNSTSL